MVTDIDALTERMQNPDESFTTAEVQALIDWHVQRAYTDEYQKARIADVMARNTEVATQAREAMAKLLGMWDESPMKPDLVVIADE